MGFFRRVKRFFRRAEEFQARNEATIELAMRMASSAGLDPDRVIDLLQSPYALRELLGHKNDAKDVIMAAGRREEGVTLSRSQTNAMYRAFMAYDKLTGRS